MKAYFVTGTGTGVGKTWVASALLRAARARGLRAAALKPAETGCGDDLAPQDALSLRAAAGRDDLSIDAIVPFRYRDPLAPAVAARLEGRPFSPAACKAAFNAVAATNPDLFLVEGAGGLLVPYTDELLGADLAAAFDLPLLIVAHAGLGTINHTLLTVNEAGRRGLAVAGIVLNHAIAEHDPSEEQNAAEIARFTPVPILATLAHGDAAISFLDALL